jgi:hypothetical protein
MSFQLLFRYVWIFMKPGLNHVWFSLGQVVSERAEIRLRQAIQVEDASRCFFMKGGNRCVDSVE